jgi:hypothetical protein
MLLDDEFQCINVYRFIFLERRASSRNMPAGKSSCDRRRDPTMILRVEAERFSQPRTRLKRAAHA